MLVVGRVLKTRACAARNGARSRRKCVQLWRKLAPVRQDDRSGKVVEAGSKSVEREYETLIAEQKLAQG